MNTDSNLYKEMTLVTNYILPQYIGHLIFNNLSAEADIQLNVRRVYQERYV